jgi:hypothetical protein
MPRGEVHEYPGDKELGKLCRELGLTVRETITACRGWNPDRYYRRRRAYERVPADFAFALAELTMANPAIPDLSPEKVLRRLHLI